MKVSFELKGGVKNPTSIIEDCLRAVFDVLNGNPILDATEITTEFLNDMEAIDLYSYYTEKGAKVTKPLKSVFLRHMPHRKDELERNWHLICQRISDLYIPVCEIIAYWGDKTLLGEGVYEADKTCFNKEGCNALSKKFVTLNNRFRVLVVETENGIGRCIAYFAGNREIFLTNFYYKGIPQTPIIMIEAFRRLLNLPKVTYKKVDFNLPIYLNWDGYLVKTEKMIPPERRYTGQKWTCPTCLSVVPSAHMLHIAKGSTHYIGCSDECLNIDKKPCDHCGYLLSEGDEYYYNDDVYCESCFNDLFAYCDICGEYVPSDDYLGDGICNECGGVCEHCEGIYRNRDLIDADGNRYCQDCFDDLYFTCDNCKEIYRSKNYYAGDGYCKHCAANCEECESVVLLEYAIKQNGSVYCEDCAQNELTIRRI